MNWQLVCLTAIAVSTVVLATIHVVLLLRIARLAQQAASAVEEVRQELKPLMVKVNRIADDASRVTALALEQVERVDRLLTVTAERVDAAVSTVRTVVAPLRSGSILAGAFRAAIALVSEWRRARANREDEDALFVG